jgi:hypothetical protein
MDNTDKNCINLHLLSKEKLKMENIVKDLYQSKSIVSEDMEEFLKFTVLIILHEYENNKQSLIEFYRQNKKIYQQYTDTL